MSATPLAIVLADKLTRAEQIRIESEITEHFN